MSSQNFFSLLEDNGSDNISELAKKKLAQQQQAKPQQPNEATKEKAPVTTGQQPTQKPQQGSTQGEQKQARPQTTENRENRENRGRGGRGQRPQTSGGDRSEPRGEGRGRGRGRGDRQPGDHSQRREGDQSQRREGERPPHREGSGQQNRPPRVRREEGSSTVDTTTDNADQRKINKSHPHDPNAPRRGRQYDRSVSGTGRGRGLKKGGEGAHNWGKEGDQATDVRRGETVFHDKKGHGKVVVKGEDTPIDGVTAPIKEGEIVGTPVDGEKTEGEAKVEKEEKKVEEEVDNTLTLEEYQKQQREKRKLLPNFKGEPVAPIVEAPVVEKKKEKKEKTVKPGDTLSIQEFLKDRAEELNKQRDAERDRGGRGRGRGQRGTGRGSKRQDAPDLKDQKAFPSLSGK